MTIGYACYCGETSTLRRLCAWIVDRSRVRKRKSSTLRLDSRSEWSWQIVGNYGRLSIGSWVPNPDKKFALSGGEASAISNVVLDSHECSAAFDFWISREMTGKRFFNEFTLPALRRAPSK
jgi:hypothetical protein